jgi:hypothetical protein
VTIRAGRIATAANPQHVHQQLTGNVVAAQSRADHAIANSRGNKTVGEPPTEYLRTTALPRRVDQRFRGHVSGSEQRVAPKGTIISPSGVLPIHEHVEFFAWLMQSCGVKG